MAKTDWRLEGEWLKNCSCAYGCPCDFNAPPTQGFCRGLVAMHIVKGHFGGVKLDGLNFAATVDFPGALHLGNGAMQAIIDERATPEQRDALFGVLSGQNSDEGTTEVEPIKNPVTGTDHRIQVVMPDGFEHRIAEVAKARMSSTAGIQFNFPDGHSTLAKVTQTPAGVAN